MIPKVPKRAPIVRQVVGGLIIFETLAFGVSYFTWSRANRDRDFRWTLKEKFPYLLECYYSLEEFLDSKSARNRQLDQKVWEKNIRDKAQPTAKLPVPE